MELTNPRLLAAKAALFVIGALLASTVVILEHPDIQTAACHGLAIWCAARAYYFLFYVVEHYVDPGFRYAGLVDLARKLAHKRRHAG